MRGAENWAASPAPKGGLLDGPGDQALHEAELARLLERVPESLMTEALPDPLHAEVGTLKGAARLVGPAGVA